MRRKCPPWCPTSVTASMPPGPRGQVELNQEGTKRLGFCTKAGQCVCHKGEAGREVGYELVEWLVLGRSRLDGWPNTTNTAPQPCQYGVVHVYGEVAQQHFGAAWCNTVTSL